MIIIDNKKTALEIFLKTLRGYNQTQIAEFCEVAPSYINDIVKKRRYLTAHVLKNVPDGKAILIKQAIERVEKEWEENI